MDDPALVQITRLLGLPRGRLSAGRAREAVGARCSDLAAALVEELVASDDVVGAESALAYLEDRLVTLGAYLPDACAEAIRRLTLEAVEGWS